MVDEKPRNPDADLEERVAVNTGITAENLRTMGFGEAADTLHATAQMLSDDFRNVGFDQAADKLHDEAHQIAEKAVQDGYVDRPPQACG
jgi:hypothetical protein